MDKVKKGVSALLRNANVRFQISVYMGPEKLLEYTTRTPKTKCSYILPGILRKCQLFQGIST
jgi:hypothetical protein